MSRTKVVIGLVAVSLALGLAFAVLPAIADSPTVTEFSVCTNTREQDYPAVWGDIVVWEDDRNNWQSDIYGYNLSSAAEFPLCTNTSDQYQPNVWGDIVVWCDSRTGNGDIYGYNLSSSSEFPVCNNTWSQDNPAVWGDIVVWGDYRNGNNDIYGKNLSSSTEFLVCNNSSIQWYPAVWGDIVVWMDQRNGNFDIYGYNLSSSIEFPICTENTSDQYNPAVSGDIVVWEDYRNGNWDIYGYNLSSSSEFPICTENTSDQGYPAVWGDIVVWADLRNIWWDIYGYNLSSSTEFPVYNNSSDQYLPDVSGNIVVWADLRNGNWDIYGGTLEWPTPTPTPTVSPTPTESPTSSPTPTPTTAVYIDAPDELSYCTNFTAYVNISYVEDFDAAIYDILYNSSVLELVSPNVSDGSINSTVIPVDYADPEGPGMIRVLSDVPGVPGVTGTGYLCKLYFHVIGSACDSSDITFNESQCSMSDKDAGEIEATWLGDSLHVALPQPTPTPTPTSTCAANGLFIEGTNNDDDAHDVDIYIQAELVDSVYVEPGATYESGAHSIILHNNISIEWYDADDKQTHSNSDTHYACCPTVFPGCTPALMILDVYEVLPNPGDVNGDGVINCCDITQCELCILDPVKYPKENYPGWDANEDSTGPNAGDILAVEMRILGTWPPE